MIDGRERASTGGSLESSIPPSNVRAATNIDSSLSPTASLPAAGRAAGLVRHRGTIAELIGFDSHSILDGLRRRPAIWLAALALLISLPTAASVLQLDPDSVEYIDIARHLLAGEGFLLGIKGFHVGDTPVLHDGLDERAPLYPFVIAAVLGAGLDLYSLQVLNALLGAACVALVYAIGATLFGKGPATLAGFLAATSPLLLVFVVPPMTQALASFLMLLATWLLVRELDAPRVRTFAVVGAALALSYLTHPSSAVLAGALLLGVVLANRCKRRLVGPIAALILVLAILVLPITIYSLAARGSLTYSGQTYLYSVRRDTDIFFRPSFQPLPPPLQFIARNRDFVVERSLRNIRDYASLLFLDQKWLLPLLPAWGFALVALLRGGYPRSASPILLLALANFLFAALTWSTFARRYQLLTFLLLLPFAVDGLARMGLARLRFPGIASLSALHLVVFVAPLAWAPTLAHAYSGTFRDYNDRPVGVATLQGLKFTGHADWVDDSDLSQLIRWVTTETQPHDVVAHGQPGIITLFTRRPSARLPRELDSSLLPRFLATYRVAYVLISDSDERQRRNYVGLEALEGIGVRSTLVGNYRVFDTRATWRDQAAQTRSSAEHFGRGVLN